MLDPAAVRWRALLFAPPVAAIALLELALPDTEHPGWILAGAILAGLVLPAVATVAWARPAASAEGWLPLACIAVVALLREGSGGADSPVTPLLALPVLWLALCATRMQLAAGLAAVAAVFLVPGALENGAADPAGGLVRAAAWTLAAGLVCLVMAALRAELEEHDRRARAFRALAHTDELTGLSNRRALTAQLLRELARVRRDGRPLCVAMLDLDDFKLYNDAHGHGKGDELLTLTATSWAAQLRDSDLIARYGGDEFAAILPDCTLEHAHELAARLRAATPERQSCSIGVAEWNGEENPAALLNRADDALYEDKRAGPSGRPQPSSLFAQ